MPAWERVIIGCVGGGVGVDAAGEGGGGGVMATGGSVGWFWTVVGGEEVRNR